MVSQEAIQRLREYRKVVKDMNVLGSNESIAVDSLGLYLLGGDTPKFKEYYRAARDNIYDGSNEQIAIDGLTLILMDLFPVKK